MSISNLDYYLQTINEEHVSCILNREESNYKTSSIYQFNILYMTELEKDLLIDEIFQTRKTFMFHYLSENETAMSINWIYNKKELLLDLIRYLNIEYRREGLKFFVVTFYDIKIILRRLYVDTEVSQTMVLKYYLDKKYRENLEKLTEETLEKFRCDILK